MRYDHCMSDIQEAVAKAIRVRLSRLGGTQEGLARAIGMSPASFSARMRARVPFDTRDMDVIARQLDLSDAFALIELAREERETPKALSA